nr:MAG TPA: hypothetical protein [Caudoviricetes sp.]DAT88953.1 MAG TPA: hypothetical protein [Caudoviricetes sp.]
MEPLEWLQQLLTKKGSLRDGPFCVIMNIHHRQRATRLSHSSFFILQKNKIFLVKVLTIYSICTIIYM